MGWNPATTVLPILLLAEMETHDIMEAAFIAHCPSYKKKFVCVDSTICGESFELRRLCCYSQSEWWGGWGSMEECLGVS